MVANPLVNPPVRPGPPLWLLLELTYRCPLHCVFCYNPTDFARSSAELSTDDWIRVLREARGLGAVQLGLSGGEPMVRDDLELIVAEAHRLGFYTNLITSGVGLTEKRLDALKKAGLDHIQLSFQDSTRQMNDFLSSTRTFELKSAVAALIKKSSLRSRRAAGCSRKRSPACRSAGTRASAAKSNAPVSGALPFGLLLSRARVLRVALSDYILLVNAMPMVALIPFILSIFGLELGAKVLVVFLFCFFPILYNTIEGADSVRPELIEVARSYRSGEWAIWRDVMLPGTFPYAMTGVRQAIGRGLVGVVAAEFFLSASGIGQVLMTSGRNFDTAGLLATVLVITFLGVALMGLGRALENRFTAWRGLSG